MERWEALLDLRPILRMEPKRERDVVGSGWRPHADPAVGMMSVERWDMCCGLKAIVELVTRSDV